MRQILIPLTFVCFASGWNAACRQNDFSADTKTKTPKAAGEVGPSDVSNAQNQTQDTRFDNGQGTNPSNSTLPTNSTKGGIADIISSIMNSIPASVPSNLIACSAQYQVPATANPFMAGVDGSTMVTYAIKAGDGPDPVDRLPLDAPILVAPTNNRCIAPGARLSFSVSGAIAYAFGTGSADANGFVSQIVSHQHGALFGKSDIVAPISSLIGVFLSSADPSTYAAPATLDFSTPAARNYDILQPEVGQIFFIGNGRTTSGAMHKIVVPQGATRLYFAVMDGYQWNNNLGGLSGGILVEK